MHRAFERGVRVAAVSIRTRPEGRVMPDPRHVVTTRRGVSIRTRPEGRVMRK